MKLGIFKSWSCSNSNEMYKKAWCTCKLVVLLNKPIAVFTFSLMSPWPLLKLPNIIFQCFRYGVVIVTSDIRSSHHSDEEQSDLASQQTVRVKRTLPKDTAEQYGPTTKNAVKQNKGESAIHIKIYHPAVKIQAELQVNWKFQKNHSLPLVLVWGNSRPQCPRSFGSNAVLCEATRRIGLRAPLIARNNN